MIFAENGNGKSTIADALISLFTDGLGSMQDKSSVDKTYITFLCNEPEKLKMSLKTNTAEYIAKHSTTAKALICPECGALPDRDKSASYFEPKSGFIRLYPITNPQIEFFCGKNHFND
jgi:hypothetical protein